MREIEAGELEGIPLSALDTNLDQFLIGWRQGEGMKRLPGGESLNDLAERAWRSVEGIIEGHNGGVVIVVSHYFAILSIICRALGLPLSHLRRLRVSVGSISVLDFQGKSPCLVVLNDTCHLI